MHKYERSNPNALTDTVEKNMLPPRVLSSLRRKKASWRAAAIELENATLSNGRIATAVKPKHVFVGTLVCQMTDTRDMRFDSAS